MPYAPVSSRDWNLAGRGCPWERSRHVTAVPCGGVLNKDDSKRHPGHSPEGVLRTGVLFGITVF